MASVYRRKLTAGKYRVKFRDPRGVWRDVLGFTDRKASEELARKLEKLAALRAAGETPGLELSRWLETLDAKLRDKLAAWGLLDGRAVAGTTPLSVHLADYKRALLNGVASTRQKGPATRKHAELVSKRVHAVLDGIGAVYLSDVTPETVGEYLARTSHHIDDSS